jgi:hypothetical protein
MTDAVSDTVSDAVKGSDSMTDLASDTSTDAGSDLDGDWLRKSAAAARLGISERMLDRQLAAGKWPKRVTAEGRVEVQVPRPPAEGQREAERALVWVQRYQQQLEAQTAPLVARIEVLARENGALQTRVQTARPTSPWRASWWPWRRHSVEA